MTMNQTERVLSKYVLSPGDGFILDRMNIPRLITLKKDMKPHIERMDYITYHDTRDALLNDIHYIYISTELGFFEIFYKYTAMEIIIKNKRNQIQQHYVTADLEHIELLIKRSKIVKFKTMFDESNDETHVPLIDMITYNNERISIHNILAWQHEIIFKQIEKGFIIKDMERAVKPGIIFQSLIIKAILIPKTIYFLKKTKLNEDIISEILKYL
jgi:hypothetical protein